MSMYFRFKPLFIFLIAFFFWPNFSWAGEISILSDTNEFSIDKDFQAKVFLDSKGENINAVEGKILYPKELLEVKDIRDGNSAVNFWIEKPNIAHLGEISFSGMTVGGFSSNNPFLFSVFFHSKKSGKGRITFENIQFLKNDGVGTKVVSKSQVFNFSISEKKYPLNSDDLDIKDSEAPEEFEPFVGSEPDMFDGKNFLIFSTQDKGSGIDHYEVKEGFFGNYVNATSPFLLENQRLFNNVYVKVVDKKGNTRIAIWQTKSLIGRYKIYLIIGIILVFSVFLFKKYAKNI